ncbi:hypothetical protein ACLOJK_032277 [Asimina triloba]
MVHVTGDNFIELVDYAGRVEAKLLGELMLSDALDESGHARHFPSLVVEPSHVLSEGFVGSLVDTHKLGSSDRTLSLVVKPGFEQLVIEPIAREAHVNVVVDHIPYRITKEGQERMMTLKEGQNIVSKKDKGHNILVDLLILSNDKVG